MTPGPAGPGAGLPPGHRWPALLQSAALIRFRHTFVPHLHRRFGDAFTVPLIPDRRPLALFTDADRAKEIFAGDPATFQAGRANAVLGPVMGPHSLLLLDGDEHRRARRLLMPAFGQSAMSGYRAVVAELARQEVARWPRGAEFASLPRMNALTLEVILQVVFGVANEDRLARLRPLVRATVEVGPVVLLGSGYPMLLRFGPWKRLAEVTRALDELLYAEIAARRTAPDLADRADVLSRLLLVGAGEEESEAPLSDEELRDQLVTLLLAGHETTAAALSWALYELGRDPEVLARAQAAADATGTAADATGTAADATGTAAAADGAAYLEAVVKESLRLHPVIPMVVRYLTAPASIGGRALPAGISVGPSILLAHQDPEAYPEPEVFRPERFLSGEVAPNTWIPFGGGVRRCIGAGFSLMEGVAVLQEVLGELDVDVLPGHLDRPRVRNITSVPHGGARIVVRPRERASRQAAHSAS